MVSPASALTSNPLGKVIELMDGLTAKITKEGEEEAAPPVDVED